MRLVVDTVSSILANTHPNFELVVVDQSKDNETLEALKPFGTDPRLRYVKIATIGKGNALNAGLTETKGSVIAITDDDCTVPPNWLENICLNLRHTPEGRGCFLLCRGRRARPNRRLYPRLRSHWRKDVDYDA